MNQVQLYDDKLDFEDNKAQGPFGDFLDDSRTHQDTGEPQFDFFGTPVYSPFGIGAGPLPTSKFIKAALNRGFDIITPKSVRTDTFPLNPYPQVRPIKYEGDVSADADAKVVLAQEYSEPLAVTNSFGIPSVPPEEWQPYIKEAIALPKKGQAIMVAFQGTARGKGKDDFVQDHVKGVQLIRDTSFKGVIEINLSCPNEGEAVLACHDTDITVKIVNAVRATFPDQKFIIKLAYFADKAQLKDLVKQAGNVVNGFSAINTMATTTVDEQGNDVYPGRPKAGVSGAPIKWAGLEMAKALDEYRKEFGYDYKIVSLGGVLSAADFHEYLDAGADTVMSVTGAMWNPELAAEIKQSL